MNFAEAGRLGGLSTSAKKRRASRRNGVLANGGGRPQKYHADPFIKDQDSWKYLRADFARVKRHGGAVLVELLHSRQEGYCTICKTSLCESRRGRPVIHHETALEKFSKRLTPENYEAILRECNGWDNLRLVHHGCNIRLGFKEER